MNQENLNDNMVIDNNITIEQLYDGKKWIHYKTIDSECEQNNDTIVSYKNIKLTIFLITICTEQLKHSLDAINNLISPYPIIVNIIMNISPTNKAYNEMRLRCTTPYFIQNDEDMELLPNALEIFNKYMNLNNTKNKIFLHTFKLIDTCLGVGTPPIIDCLKLYNNDIMKEYPTFSNGEDSVSSVDQLWHKPLINDSYVCKCTPKIIGYHGKHRTNFDLMLRHCKILKSICDPIIKTNSGHLCKLLRALCSNNSDCDNIVKYFKIVIQHFSLFCRIDFEQLNTCIHHVNTIVKKNILDMYGIKNRFIIPDFDNLDFNEDMFCELFNLNEIDKEQLYCIIAILCVATNNYEYSYDKYPVDIYNYFNNILINKKEEIQFIYSNDVSSTCTIINYDKDKKTYVVYNKNKYNNMKQYIQCKNISNIKFISE